MKRPRLYISGADDDYLSPRKRLFYLDQRFRDSTYPNARELANCCGVSRKTIYRDIEMLRVEFGAPIQYDKKKQGYTYTEPTYALPSAILTQHDLFALAVAENAVAQYDGTPLAQYLRNAFDKLLSTLPEDLSEAHEIASRAIHFGGLPAPEIDPEIWSGITTAIRDRVQIDMTYRPPDRKEPIERRLAPLLLIARERDWFLVAQEQESDQTPTYYYLPRIESVERTSSRFEVPEDFSPRTHLRHSFNGLNSGTEPVEVVLRFHPEAAHLIRERAWSEDQKLEEQGNGGVIATFQTNALVAVERKVLSHGGSVEVLKPESLRRRVAERAGMLVRRHQERRARGPRSGQD